MDGRITSQWFFAGFYAPYVGNGLLVDSGKGFEETFWMSTR